MKNPFRRKALHYPTVPGFVTTPFTAIDRGIVELPSSNSSIYESVAPVAAVVNLIARSLGQVTLRAYLKTLDGPRELADGSRLVALMRQPGLTYAMALDLAVHGESLHLLVGEGRWATELVRLDPEQTEVQGSGALVTGFKAGQDAYAPEDVLFIRTPSLASPRRGLSPLKALRPILQENAAAQSFRLGSWQGSTPGQWLERPLEAPLLSDEARERFTESLRGKKAGSIVLLEEGTKVSTAGPPSARDSEYLASRRFVYEQVCAAYGVSASALSGTSSDRNQDASHRALYMDVVAPLCAQIAEAVNEQVVPALMGPQAAGGRIFVAFDLEEKISGSFAQAAEIYSTALAGRRISQWMR